MPYPADLPTVTVRHRIVGTDGTPARGGGRVTAVLTGRLWTGQGSVVPTQYTATVQEDGTYELVLPPVDHPDIVAGRGEAYLVTEPAATIDTRRPGRVATEQFHVAPTTDMVGQTVDVSDVLVTKPKPGGGVERVTITGPATDESLAGIIADPSSLTAASLSHTIETEVVRRAGTVPIFGSQAEAQAWEAENPGAAALWFDAGVTEVTATGPTWTDNPLGGGTWTTPPEPGVTYTPASGTATPGQEVTVTATAKPGYALVGTRSWTHVFPAAAHFTDFTAGIDGWTPAWRTTPAFTADAGTVTTAVGGRRILTWDEIQAAADVEIVTRARMSKPETVTVGGGIIVRGGGTDPSATGYGILMRSNEAVLVRYQNGAYAELATRPFTLAADAWYWMRLRAIGDSISMRVWLDTNPEPATWTATVTDTAITAPGAAGLLTATNPGVMTWDLFGAAKDGATAPKGA